MHELEVIKILQQKLKFTDQSIDKLKMLEIELLNANKKHNFIKYFGLSLTKFLDTGQKRKTLQ